MTAIREYYRDGFMFGTLKGPSHKRFLDVLEELFNTASLPEPFRWEQKYANTLDLRPNAHAFDPSIIDVLFESNVPALLNRLVGPDMVLFHTQVRRSSEGPSYMSWHRDSYDYGQPVGNFPPAHKVIFYPLLPGVSHSHKLRLCVGSHNCHFGDAKADYEQALKRPIERYFPSVDQFLLFNTALMHEASSDWKPSVRVIYSFIRKVQFEELYSHEPIHAEQVRIYEERMPR